jgi:hypothetical protein
VGAKIATTPGRGEPHPLGSLLHKPVMRELIVVALIVARKIPDLRLVFNALLRRHQLPAARISLVGAPRSKGVGRARYAEKQDQSSNAWRTVQHVVIPSSANRRPRKRSQAGSGARRLEEWRPVFRAVAAIPRNSETLRFKLIATGSVSRTVFRPSPRSGKKRKKRFDARP